MLHPLAEGNRPPAEYGVEFARILHELGGFTPLRWLVEAIDVPWLDAAGVAREVRAAAADPSCRLHLAVDEDGWLFAHVGSS